MTPINIVMINGIKIKSMVLSRQPYWYLHAIKDTGVTVKHC